MFASIETATAPAATAAATAPSTTGGGGGGAAAATAAAAAAALHLLRLRRQVGKRKVTARKTRWMNRPVFKHVSKDLFFLCVKVPLPSYIQVRAGAGRVAQQESRFASPPLHAGMPPPPPPLRLLLLLLPPPLLLLLPLLALLLSLLLLSASTRHGW